MAFSLVPVDIARTVLGISGLIALLLSVAGLYGLVSYTAAQRLKEIGIRIALGAGRVHVFGVIVGGALKLAAIGALLGLAGAVASTRLLAVFIYGVSATDPLTFAAVSLLLMAVAVGASYAAARHGMRGDPMVALRHE